MKKIRVGSLKLSYEHVVRALTGHLIANDSTSYNTLLSAVRKHNPHLTLPLDIDAHKLHSEMVTKLANIASKASGN